MIETPTPGTRVKCGGIVGTVKNRAQVSFDPRAGWEYVVELDNGNTVLINELDMIEATPADEERSAEKIRSDREWNEHIEERNRHRAEARERNRLARLEQQEQEQADRLAEQEAARAANNDEQRRAHALEYGLQSLK